MVGDLNAVAGVSGDVDSVKLAVAGLADVNAHPVVAADGAAAAPDDGAGMDDVQPIAAVVDNAVAAAGIAFCSVRHLEANQVIVADDVVGYRDAAVATVQEEMAGHHADAEAQVVGHADTIKAQAAAVGGDAAARAVLDRKHAGGRAAE